MNVCRLYPKLSNKCLKMVWLCCAKNVRIGHSVSDHQHRTTLATTTRRPLRLVPHPQGCGIQCTPNLLHNKAMLLNLKTEEYYCSYEIYTTWFDVWVWSGQYQTLRCYTSKHMCVRPLSVSTMPYANSWAINHWPPTPMCSYSIVWYTGIPIPLVLFYIGLHLLNSGFRGSGSKLLGERRDWSPPHPTSYSNSWD